MITVVVGKRRNTTPWFPAVGEKTAQTEPTGGKFAVAGQKIAGGH
jgi:hypothetical protein